MELQEEEKKTEKYEQYFIDKNEGEGLEHCKFYGKNEIDKTKKKKT